MSRTFTKVGVVGLGTMGAGIVEVFARSGLEVVGVEVAGGRPGSWPRPPGVVHVARGQARQAHRGREGRDLRADHVLDVAATTWPTSSSSSRRSRSTSTSSRRRSRPSTRSSAPHAILATNTSSLSVTEISVATDPSRAGRGHALLQPGSRAEARRGDPHRRHRPEGHRRRRSRSRRSSARRRWSSVTRPGFIANALLFGYLNHAVALYESRYASREDIDAAMKLGCGLPMGPLALLDLIGLDTAYEILDTMYRQSRDRLHAPAPLLKQMVTAGLRGRKTGRGFYTYETAGQPRRRRRTPSPPTSSTVRCPARATYAPSVSSAPGRWPPASSRCSPRRATTSSTSPGARRRSSPSAQPCEKSLEKAVLRGKLEESDRDAALARVTGSYRLDDLADRDLVVEAVVEELTVKTALFETLDEICKPGAVLATTTSSLPVVERRGRDRAPRRRRGPALLQPGAGHEARRGRARPCRRPRRRSPPRARSSAASTSTPCSAPTVPASSSTRCSSPTSTTPCGCSRTTTPRPTTSTPP